MHTGSLATIFCDTRIAGTFGTKFHVIVSGRDRMITFDYIENTFQLLIHSFNFGNNYSYIGIVLLGVCSLRYSVLIIQYQGFHFQITIKLYGLVND